MNEKQKDIVLTVIFFAALVAIILALSAATPFIIAQVKDRTGIDLAATPVPPIQADCEIVQMGMDRVNYQFCTLPDGSRCVIPPHGEMSCYFNQGGSR